MYTEEQIETMFSNILDEIESGRAVRNILKDDGMPDGKTFYKWLDSDETKVQRYARACEKRADAIFEDIIEIADDSSNDTTVNAQGDFIANTEFIQRSRLRVDARKWVVSKLNPKKYGDKIEQTHTGNLGITFVEEKSYIEPKDSEKI